MEIKDGLYLFPDGEKFWVYGLYLCRVIDFGMASAGELLIEFLDFDFAKISSVLKSAKAFEGNAVFNAMEELEDNAITVLIKNMTSREWVKIYDFSQEGWQNEYSISVERILNSIITVHQNIWELADYYCERFGSAEERFDLLHALNEPFTSMAVEEIISARKPGKEFFGVPSENDYCFPYTKAYRFTDVESYAQFIFLNMMRYNPNFSKCNYCYNFFIPKTKKLTRFCSRVNPETGKTCKEIAPTVYRNEDINSNKILKQYDLAARRNYMRMCRGEERVLGESADRDIEPQIYFGSTPKVVEIIKKVWYNIREGVGENDRRFYKYG